MIWLALQMWMLLAIAFVLGVGVGWWIWSRERKSDSSSSAADFTGTLSADLSSRKPILYDAPGYGPKDDLTQIIGIDDAIEKKLNKIGVFYIRQIAEWGPARVLWIEEKLGERGRVEREDWVDQARTISAQAAAE